MAKYRIDRNGNVTVNNTEEKKKKPKYSIDRNGNVTVNTITDEDIAPVRTDISTVQPAQQERTWFQSGALGDGLTKENVKKTYFGTVADFWENLGAGAIGLGEKALDALVTIAPYITQGMYYQNGGGYNIAADRMFQQGFDTTKKDTAAFVAKDLYDEQAVARKIISDPIGRATGANTDGDSLLGQKSEGLIQSTGQLGAQIGLQAVGVPWWLTSATTTLGAESEGAVREGADLDSAVVRGAISASAEVLTEQIGGIKFKGASLDDGITKLIARGVSNKAARTMLKLGVDAGSEAMEEGLSWFAGKFGEYITSNGEETLSQLLTSEEAMDELVESMIGGAVMGSGFGTVNAANANKQGKDYVSGLTKNEQAVIDKVYKDLVAEEAANSKDGKVSGKRKNALFEEAIKAMDEGSISIETIEEVLGGDNYKAYRDAVDNETALQKEYDGLNAMRLGELTGVQTDRKAELRRQLDEIKSGNRQALLKEKLGKDVAELAKVSRLSESYREKERRSQAFQADVSRYNGRSQQIVQKAIDSGILNNTRRSHQLVDLIAKVGGDKNMDFDFANNEKLKASGFALDGKTVNGVLTGSGVTININSAKALNSVVGHEITHVLEGSEFYSALAETATALAKAKGEYDSRLKNIEALYSEELEGYGGEGRTAALEKELVADLVGDYLFTDTEFINRLSTGDRNTFEKIFDEIKYLCRVVTAGSKEAKQLEKVKRAFEDAYRRDARNTANDGGAKYAISKDTDGNEFVDVKEDIFDANDGESVARTIQKVIAERFNNLIDVHGQKIQINKTTNDEFRRSNSANELLESSPQAYSDKLRTIANADEILSAAKNWIGEAIKHQRKDDIVEFARANVAYRVGETGYVADVIVGTRKNGAAVLYDLVNIYEKEITEAPVTMASNNSSQRRQDASVEPMLPQENTNVKPQFSLSNAENVKKAEEYFGVTYRISEAGYLLTDGRLLDFSGRHEGGSGGYRSVDHRDIVDAMDEDYGGNSYSGGMVRFMQEGNIRLSPESGGINLCTKPNKAQMQTLDRFITNFRGEVILDIDDENGNTVVSVEYPKRTYSKKILDDIKAYFEEGKIPEVRSSIGQFLSLSSQEDMFPVRKDLDSVRGKIYGSDVELRELGPVRKDLQTEETAQDPYDDLPFDMPDNLAEGQLTDEELEADAKRQPVETVTQRLKVKFASLRQELQTNEQGRKESWDAYDRRIEELQQRYDAKPKKYTKAANAILRQIAKQKQLQTQRDAEFEKRISDIKKKIDQTRELMKWDHTREDLLEKQLRQVDEKLEADKQDLEDEFRERRIQAERVADRASYFSGEARILLDEILYHKKGTGFSDDIRELLDHGHSFKEIKDALRTVEQYPNGMRHRDSIAEQNARMILERNYENAVYEADEIETDYQNRLNALEAKAKEDRESYTVAAQRKNKQQQYEQLMEDLVGDTSTWQDKKLGLQYQVNTLRRNLRDVVRDEKGNRDIAKADAIWEELQGKYNQHEAELKRESARIKQAYADMKITKEEDVYIQMLGEFRHNPETELSLETVEGYYQEHKDKIDTEKVDKAIELARKTYDELLVRVNAALREQGMKEIPYRQGYFPHFTEEAKGRFRMFLEKVLNFKYKSDDIPTDIAGLTEGFTPNRSYQHFNKQRVSDLTEYNFSKGMDSYVHGALDWIYHIEDIQKRRTLENHLRYIHSEEGTQARINAAKANEMWDADQVQEEIDKILKEAKNPLNNLVTDLRTGTNILAGKKNTMDRGMEQRFNRKVYSIMSGASSRINANHVAGSVSSALTNFIPITQSWGEVSPVSSVVAAKDTILSYVYDDGVVDKSDFLTNRLRQEENLYKTGWDKFGDKIGWMMEAADNFSAQTIWRSKYNENINKGMSEAEAIKNADEFAEGVMAGRSRGNMPTAFDEKNPFTRILTAFQLEVNNLYGYMFKDMPQNMQKETKARLVAGYAKIFLGAYVYNALYSQLTGRNAAFDPIRIIQELLGDLFPDEDEEEKKPSEIVGGFLEDVAQEVPFVGGLMGGGRIPISSALPYGDASGPIEGISNFIKDIEDGKKFTWEWLNPAFYLLTPVGGGQLRKTAQGLSMFLGDKPVSGSYTSSGNLRFPVAETPLSIAQAAVFGQWANKNARTYIDEGRSPIPESQIQDFLDSGLTYEAWWERKDDLKKVDNDFEANEPIMAFRQVLDQVEETAAGLSAKDSDLLKEKFMRSAADELSDLKAEMKELVTMPLSDTHRQRNMQALQKKANEIAQKAMDDYSKVQFDGEYATVGEKVWKRDEDGQWRRLTGEALTKYQVTSAADSDVYATDGTNHYRWYEPGEDAENPEPGWRKVSKKELERQNAVTSALGITPEEYWGDRREEYSYAYENPEKYLVVRAAGGYEKYTAYKTEINKLESDKDKNGKTISGSKKKKVIKYINGLNAAYGEKLVLFKSLYPADDTYNEKIVQYLNGRKDLTAEEKKKILKELDFTVKADGTVTW